MGTQPKVFDGTRCKLGEGPFWVPAQNALIWFNIEGKALRAKSEDKHQKISFEEYASCAAVLEDGRLIVAGQSGLWVLDLESETKTLHFPMPELGGDFRPNDGRADPWGGFWFSRMSLVGQDGCSEIYRYYKGEVRCLVRGLTVPNSICFLPDQSQARFSDTRQKKVFTFNLDSKTGWPSDDARLWKDFNPCQRKPDGAVFSQDGTMWIAHWGSGCVSGYDKDGKFVSEFFVHTPNTTCPAFGGENLSELFVTTAWPKEPEVTGIHLENAGKTYSFATEFRGVPEPCVTLG